MTAGSRMVVKLYRCAFGAATQVVILFVQAGAHPHSAQTDAHGAARCLEQLSSHFDYKVDVI